MRQNSGISWGYMSIFRALVGRIMGRMDGTTEVPEWLVCAMQFIPKIKKKQIKNYAHHNKLMGSVYHFCHDVNRRLNIQMG